MQTIVNSTARSGGGRAANIRKAAPAKTAAHQKRTDMAIQKIQAALSKLPREKRQVYDAIYDEHGLPI